jgi:dolichyl-phosphate-mannose-protein mannosyltransferase
MRASHTARRSSWVLAGNKGCYLDPLNPALQRSPAHRVDGVVAARTLAIFPMVLGIALISTNRWFTEVDDECAIVDQAARPLRQTVQRFLNGVGMHEHPPLYDVLLHGWLRLTAGNIHLLRLPAILFYVVGVWVLSLAARQLGGASSQFWTLALASLSPFGFHFGRLATWYSFGFLLVSWLTLAYLRFLEQPRATNWVIFAAIAISLTYANYFGWAFLAMIAIDYLLRNRHQLGHAARWLAATAAVLLIAYLPIFRAFEHEVSVGSRPHLSIFGFLIGAGYNLYLIFVSESVAVWFWPLSVVALAAIGLCLFLLLKTPSPAKRFFFCFACVIAILAALGIVMPKRTFFTTPWLLLAMGVALGTMPHRMARRALLTALGLCAAIGWYGIFSRNLYAAPHWLEPWEQVAQRSAGAVRNGGIVIGNNPSFFFYLTYLLPVSSVAPHAGGFAGLLPDSVRAAGVYTPQQWIEAGTPMRPNMLLVEGVHYGNPADATGKAQSWLDQRCSLDNLERRVHDSAAGLKQSYVGFSQPEWRVQVRNYSCR